MRLAFVAFSERGHELAAALAEELGGTVSRGGSRDGGDKGVAGEGEFHLRKWTEVAFAEAEGLVFVGALGIAVRAVAPFLRGKSVDPAVVAVDETGRYAIPVLGGHLGGANDLARRIAAVCGAEAVITTATDRRGVFAVDEWARHAGCHIANPGRIKAVSAALLAGKTCRVRSDFVIAGSLPEGIELTGDEACDIRVSVQDERDGLGAQDERRWLSVIPKILVLGVGCRRGIPEAEIERFFVSFMERNGCAAEGVFRVCSIDRKAEETGLVSFCRRHRFEFITYTPAELAAAAGSFTASEYVLRTTGVDNVCERSAVLGSGGELLCRKEAGSGVTMALAAVPFQMKWQ